MTAYIELPGGRKHYLYRSHEVSMLPEIVDGPGEYRTRCGDTVVIERQDYRGRLVDRHMWIGYYASGRGEGIPERWDVSGRIWFLETNKTCDNDIVEKV